MADKLLICKHNDGLGHCDVFGGEYCVESPCQHEELVEYAPVVHGRWNPSTIQYGFVICNICGDYRSSHWVEDRFNYCPNCGAKMDGERKGDDD